MASTSTTASARPHASAGSGWPSLAAFTAATVAVALLGSLATDAGQDWYDTLDHPAYTPPGATFGIVWSVLYAAIALAGWRTWRRADTPAPTVWWAIQMVLNLAWTVVFFGLESPWGGLVVIAALIVAEAIHLRLVFGADRVAGWLLVPYLAWLCFAAALNVGVLVLN